MSTKTEFAAFEALDLTPIKMKLMHLESGEGWSEVRANAVEAEYRRFLFLMKKYPDDQAAPTVDVDTFWHYHILDTMKYARDCEQVFGYFLHHYPYVGIGEQAVEGEQLRAGERMRELYAAEFGVASSGQEAWCASPGQPQARMQAGDAAWCAAPGKALVQGSDTAWCAAPGKALAKGGDSAWCASPGKARGSDAAWCASPGEVLAEAVKTAWCASPGKSAATAWCASPGKALLAA